MSIMKPAILLALAGICGTAFAQHLGGHPRDGLLDPIRWQTLASGNDSKITRAETRHFMSQQTFEMYYKQMLGLPVNARINIPIVADWMHEDVFVIHSGAHRGAGHGIYVESVIRSSAAYYDIGVVRTSPFGGGSVGMQQVYSPFVIIRMKRAVGAPRFQLRHIQIANYGGYGNGHGRHHRDCECGCHRPAVYTAGEILRGEAGRRLGG